MHVQQGGGLEADPGHNRDYISQLVWKRLGIFPEDVERVKPGPRLLRLPSTQTHVSGGLKMLMNK